MIGLHNVVIVLLYNDTSTVEPILYELNPMNVRVFYNFIKQSWSTFA